MSQRKLNIIERHHSPTSYILSTSYCCGLDSNQQSVQQTTQPASYHIVPQPLRNEICGIMTNILNVACSAVIINTVMGQVIFYGLRKSVTCIKIEWQMWPGWCFWGCCDAGYGRWELSVNEVRCCYWTQRFPAMQRKYEMN